ncbi:DUF1963 domain-containing protein [Novosphingobium sp. BL-8A]|uniref:DUF1963 domain-containing protein n=1 Tax=Novosphingobium sp. BL-8A TaxID=3127639 RepID=UPI0037580C8F
MRRWIAVFAVFALTAIVAGYVALFPFASQGSPVLRPTLETLDQTAARVVALGGRGPAVIVPLAAGAVLALLLAVVGRGGTQAELAPAGGGIPVRGGSSQQGASRQGRRRKLVHPDPELVWRPEPDPVAPDMDHVPGLPREHAQEDLLVAEANYPAEPEPDPELLVETARSGPRHPPVVLVRHPRERDTDEQTWFDSASWLGGLPRLGDRAWPQDEAGPLPFAAQIDLAELAAAFPESPLPLSGTLAFFLGSGAVIEVPEANHPFTAPPADLPPAFDEGGYPLPEHPSRLSRPYFPFWPVRPLAVELPEPVESHDARALEAAEAAWLDARVKTRDGAYAANEPNARLWWHGVVHLADCLHVAMDGAARQVAMEQDRLDEAQARLKDLAAQPNAAPADIDEAHAALATSEAELPALEAEQGELGRMIDAMEGFVAGRDLWAPLSTEEMEVMEEVLAQIHHDCGRLVRFYVPQTLGALATISLRAMVTGDAGTFAQVPDAELARINGEHLLAIGHQHQLFGTGAPSGASGHHPADDVLLLQLGCDDLVEWNWGESGLFQFRIAPEDLAAARWDRVTLTFEPG